jgi:hypothetical protein
VSICYRLDGTARGQTDGRTDFTVAYSVVQLRCGDTNNAYGLLLNDTHVFVYLYSPPPCGGLEERPLDSGGAAI